MISKKKNKKQNKWDEKNKTLVLSWRVNLWKGWNNWMTTLSSRGLYSKWNFVWLFYPSWWLGMKSMCDQTFSKKLALLRKCSLNHREQDEWNSIGSIQTSQEQRSQFCCPRWINRWNELTKRSYLWLFIIGQVHANRRWCLNCSFRRATSRIIFASKIYGGCFSNTFFPKSPICPRLQYQLDANFNTCHEASLHNLTQL